MGSLWFGDKPKKKEKQARLPKKPRFEPRQIIHTGKLKPVFIKASKLKCPECQEDLHVGITSLRCKSCGLILTPKRSIHEVQ